MSFGPVACSKFDQLPGCIQSSFEYLQGHRLDTLVTTFIKKLWFFFLYLIRVFHVADASHHFMVVIKKSLTQSSPYHPSISIIYNVIIYIIMRFLTSPFS